MPIYQYECKKCEHTLEEFQKVTDEPLVKCPKCKKKSLFRVVTGGLGFIIKGRTVGAIADENSNKFSSDYKHHLESKNKKKDVLSERGFKTASSLEKNKKKMSKSEKDKMRKLMSATPEQRSTYIEKGTI